MKLKRYSLYSGAHKRHTKVAKIGAFALPILVMIFAAFYFWPHRGQNEQATAPQISNLSPAEDAVTLLRQNEENVQSSYDFSTIALPTQGAAAIGTLEHGVLHSDDRVNTPLPMASIAKVVTALAILKKSPIAPGTQGDRIALSLQDEQYYNDYFALGGTITAVADGQSMSQYEALQAMLLASSNNMADTLVDYYFESKEEYLEYANAMLKNMGLEQTVVADTTGFSPQSVSTASELVKLGQEALNNSVVAQIVAMPEATIAVAGTIPNYNVLISEPEVTGIKAGNTDEAGLCLLFSANIESATGDSVTVIGVVLGIEEWQDYQLATITMLDGARQAVSSQ